MAEPVVIDILNPNRETSDVSRDRLMDLQAALNREIRERPDLHPADVVKRDGVKGGLASAFGPGLNLADLCGWLKGKGLAPESWSCNKVALYAGLFGLLLLAAGAAADRRR